MVLLEQPLQVVFGVGLEQPRRRALERQTLQVRFVERDRQAFDHLLHERPADTGSVPSMYARKSAAERSTTGCGT